MAGRLRGEGAANSGLGDSGSFEARDPPSLLLRRIALYAREIGRNTTIYLTSELWEVSRLHLEFYEGLFSSFMLFIIMMNCQCQSILYPYMTRIPDFLLFQIFFIGYILKSIFYGHPIVSWTLRLRSETRENPEFLSYTDIIYFGIDNSNSIKEDKRPFLHKIF